jgi:sporulation protein YlmC with PRC-barrel domain
MTMLVWFDLLDRQIVDSNDEPVGNVDDIEFEVDSDGVLYATTLLVGAQSWGRRLGGRLGRWITSSAARLKRHRGSGPLRIPYEWVAHVDSAVHLSVARDVLAEPELETWLREHLIDKIPGADDA